MSDRIAMKKWVNVDTIAALVAMILSFIADATSIELSDDTVTLLRMFSGAALMRGAVPAVQAVAKKKQDSDVTRD